MSQNSNDDNAFCLPQFFESAFNLWFSTIRSWQDLSFSPAGESAMEQWMKAPFTMWRSFQAAVAGGAETKNDTKSFFDLIYAVMRTMGAGGPGDELPMWLMGASKLPDDLEKFRHETLEAMTGFHEKGIRPLLNMPQVGLTRVFQEKINRFLDNLNSFQAALSEFQLLLSGPMEKSFITMKGELEKLREKGDFTEDSKAFYGMWIKVLEKHYMTLFKSAEYSQALSRLMNETASFRLSGNDVLIELCELLPIPTNKDMDEVYRELYTLKKQAGETAKKIRKMESALAERKSDESPGNARERDYHQVAGGY